VNQHNYQTWQNFITPRRLLAHLWIKCNHNYSCTTYESCDCRHKTRGCLHSTNKYWHHRLKEEDHLIASAICLKYLCALTSLDPCILLHSTSHNCGADQRRHEQGMFPMPRRMTNVVVGVGSVHGFVWSSKLWATTWACSFKFWYGHWCVGHGWHILRRTKLNRGTLMSI
jgi:hypothetical protein